MGAPQTTTCAARSTQEVHPFLLGALPTIGARMKNLEAILEQLNGVRRNGAGWKALCPAHADKDPSLSINERDGKILLYCHAGCSQVAVLAAAKINPRELFSDA